MKNIIEHLALEPHPEGGYYKRIFEGEPLATPLGDRPTATAINYLLQKGDFSTWHRLLSDEIWFFHEGCPIEIHCFSKEHEYFSRVIGPVSLGFLPHMEVSAGTVFAAAPKEELSGFGDWSLIHCMVTPGFDFQDFSFVSSAELLESFPQHESIIHRYAK